MSFHREQEDISSRLTRLAHLYSMVILECPLLTHPVTSTLVSVAFSLLKQFFYDKHHAHL